MEYEEGQIMRWVKKKDANGKLYIECPDCGTPKPWLWRNCPICTACTLRLQPPEGCE